MPAPSADAADQDGCLDGIVGISVGAGSPRSCPLYCLLSESEAGGSHIPELGTVDDDLEGPLARQLHDLCQKRAGQVGSADDE